MSEVTQTIEVVCPDCGHRFWTEITMDIQPSDFEGEPD